MSLRVKLKQSGLLQKVYYTKKLKNDPRNNMMCEDEKRKHIVICCSEAKKSNEIKKVLKNCRITIRPGERFQTWIDTGVFYTNANRQIENTSINYSIIINNSLNQLIEEYERAQKTDSNQEIKRVLVYIRVYIKRIIEEIDRIIQITEDNNNLKKTKKHFENMINQKALCLEEALQRILFWSSLFWQTNHRLMGLGRLDKVLEQFEDEAVNKYDDAYQMISDFVFELHRYYPYKSSSIAIGDTGQIIILGGIDKDGSYFSNAFTYLFLEAVKDSKLPDPKTLLRVSEKMPKDLLTKAVDSISTGIGCPLLSNDDVVVPALINFGYAVDDAYDYVTSACWEPLSFGRSFEQNNISDINYAQALTELFSGKAIHDCTTYDNLVSMYKDALRIHCKTVLRTISEIKWEKNPLLSLFFEGCIETGKDISEGGTKYNNYGVLSVGLSNTINSLLNIKHCVFEENRLNINDLCSIVLNDYTDENVLDILSENSYFGKDDVEVLDLIKNIEQVVYEMCYGYTNPLGGKLKWGLSSSNYAEKGKKTLATLDGRKAGTPLGVHISNTHYEPYTELISFASKLNYDGCRSNGNVVDFFVSPNLIKENMSKFVTFVAQGIKMGIFQLQCNVVNSEVLRDALVHPEMHKDLIVRVWGFSAYFVDLPDYYKQLLITRAEASENVA